MDKLVKKVKVAFRTDASVQIGTGHVMRCATLANYMREQRFEVYFVCRAEQGNLCEWLEQAGYTVLRLDASKPLDQARDAQEMKLRIEELGVRPDAIVVDHYGLDYRWEEAMQSITGRVLVIDDLANRRHACDLLLDQNYNEDLQNRYADLVPEHCRLLLGPAYLILRPEFYQAAGRRRTRDNHIRRVLVFFGGSDPTCETLKALEAMDSITNRPYGVDVVVGSANPHRFRIEQMCSQMGIQYHCQIDYLADLMAEADLSLGAGGVTMWERCFLGLPSVVTTVAENQIASTKAAAHFGAVFWIGWHEQVQPANYLHILSNVQEPTHRWEAMSVKAKQLMASDRTEPGHSLIDYLKST
ncbi:UDP-2,4-diacetamido-2,4,6-trideoxy-beta-L-altropyranose hydrolase [Marinicrinis lubricantis]|uniref:UDP-2,4-diacetamido-2,4, 6-trideoxy-beta-L-altropyranose hydrolase n=1 Tax=Marinicrinis lubricantis TaxID=2086470 RepID=A0ABW1IT87_9BACL